MKKIAITFLFLLSIITVNAQETTIDTTKLWTKKGNISLLFNQSSYNKQWLGGGTSNIAGNFGVNYDFNYKNGDVVWDNKFILAYGLNKIKGDARTAKTDDRLELNSLWGKKATGEWYYSMFFNFKTQMDSGLDKNMTKISNFFSPAYFQFGPSFGVLQGDSSRFEFGASISGYYKINIMTNVSIENRLNLYSNYLSNPQNVDVDYQMNVIMKINKYLSANVAFQSIYDDNSIKAVQTREVFGLGVNYGF